MELDGVCLNCFARKGPYEVCPYCGYADGTAPREPYLLYPGTRLLERYVIGTVLGIGGFGVTYRAWDSRLGAIVAIKEFFPQGLVNRIPGETLVRVFSGQQRESHAQQLARFLDEAKNLAKMAGDNHIVSVMDFFEANNTAYIVMEYLDGVTLKAYMESQGGRLPPQLVVDIGSQLLAALSSIHRRGVIHRDISPDNIFILHDGRVKVLDFGAARFGPQEPPGAAGAVVKVGYAPPEQYRANMKQGVWTDIYAAGATLYKMFTGVTPVSSVDRMERDTLRRPSQLGAVVEPYLDKVAMQAMALKPDLRFQSADAMLAALENRTGAAFPEEELKRRKRNRGMFVAVAALVLAVAGGVIAWQATRAGTDTLAGADIQPDSIQVCIPDMGAETTAAYGEIVDAFTRQYPEHAVELLVKPYDEFMRMAEGDLGTTRAPAVVHSGYFDPKPLTQAADLGLLAASLDKNAYWFLADYETLYPGMAQMPTGLDVMVGYADSLTVAQNGGEVPQRFGSIAQVGNLVVAGQMSRLGLRGSDAAALLQLYHPAMMQNDTFSAEGLAADVETLRWLYANNMAQVDGLSADVPLQVGWASGLRAVRETWPGRYAVLPMEGPQGMLGMLSDEWTVNAAVSENQQMVGMLFIHFLLSDYAQNTLYVQRGGYVPLNRAAYGQFLATNAELGFIDKQAMGGMQVLGQRQTALTDFSAALYQQVLAADGPGTPAEDFIGGYRP